MPRAGAVYQLPPGSTVTPSTTILSAWANAFSADVQSTFNTAWPVALGGTGGTSAITSFDALATAGTTVPTAGTLVLSTVTGPLIDLSGNTTVTAVTLNTGQIRITRATGDFQITVGASLIGNAGGSNVAVKTGDLIIWEGYAGSVVQFWVIRVSGQPISAYSARNRMVNGAKLVSQENGQTSGTTNGRYLSDQNAMYFVSSAGTFTGVNVLTISPAGGYRDRITITVADASLAAGEYLTYTQNLEGSNVRDFKWGAAGANAIVIRFGFKGPAGTYAMALHNSGAARSYVALFTITAPQANTDTIQTFAVPGDVTGTWLTADGVIGVTMDIVLACGSTFQGATGWQAGNILGTSGVSNGMGTGAAVFEFFDCGIRLDPNATGIYGAYEVGDTDAVYRAERYWVACTGLLMGFASGSTIAQVVFRFPFAMCKTPSIAAGSSLATLDHNAASNVNPSSISLTALTSNNSGAEFRINNYSTLTAGQAVAIQSTANPIAVFNSRV